MPELDLNIRPPRSDKGWFFEAARESAPLSVSRRGVPCGSAPEFLTGQPGGNLLARGPLAGLLQCTTPVSTAQFAVVVTRLRRTTGRDSAAQAQFAVVATWRSTDVVPSLEIMACCRRTMEKTENQRRWRAGVRNTALGLGALPQFALFGGFLSSDRFPACSSNPTSPLKFRIEFRRGKIRKPKLICVFFPRASDAESMLGKLAPQRRKTGIRLFVRIFFSVSLLRRVRKH